MVEGDVAGGKGGQAVGNRDREGWGGIHQHIDPHITLLTHHCWHHCPTCPSTPIPGTIITHPHPSILLTLIIRPTVPTIPVLQTLTGHASSCCYVLVVEGWARGDEAPAVFL